MNESTFQGNGKVTYVPVIVNGKQAKQTNADRIRAMTDEKLAKYLAWLEDPQACYVWELYENKEIIDDWLEWLKQEAE